MSKLSDLGIKVLSRVAIVTHHDGEWHLDDSHAPTISVHLSAYSALNAVRKYDEREAKRSQKIGLAVAYFTTIEWRNVPAGFVPPNGPTR